MSSVPSERRLRIGRGAPAGRCLARRLAAAARRWSLARDTDHVVLVAVGLFAVTLGTTAGMRHHAFASSRYNLGNFTQALWNTAHGRLFEMTADTGEQFLRLGAHVEPIMLLLVPAWWAWPSPVMLVVLQAILLALGAVPVYWLAEKHLDSVAAARRVALAFLLYPSVGLLAINEFHAVTLAVPFLLFATWYLDEHRLLPFALFALLAAATKEQIGLTIAALGVWYAIRHARALVGAAIALCGTAWSAVAFLVVIPHFSLTGSNPFVGRYDAVGGSPEGIAATLFHSPLDIAAALATPINAAYVTALVVPVAGLCLLAPLALVPALPELGINLLSTHYGQKTIAWQYVAGIVPFVFLATVYALRRRPARVHFFSRLVVMAAAINFAIGIPHLTAWLHHPIERDAAETAVRLVPPHAPVSVSGHLGAHLSERTRVFNFPTVGDADWIVLHRGDVWIPWPVEEADVPRWRRAVQRYETSRDWRVAFDRDGILVLRRVD